MDRRGCCIFRTIHLQRRGQAVCFDLSLEQQQALNCRSRGRRFSE